MRTIHCPICGADKKVRAKQRTCSRECGVRWVKRTKGGDFHRRAGEVAGRVSAVTTRQKSEALWRARYPDVPIAIARAIYQHGFNSGHATGQRRGFRHGYEAAQSGLRLARI